MDPSAMVDRRNGKPKRVTAAMRKVITLLLDGECRTVKAAGARAGLTPEYLSRALRKPHIRAYLDERTRASLDEGKTIAAARLRELIHAKSEHVSFDAAKHTLAINGIAPPSDGQGVSVNISNNQIVAGYVIDLTASQPAKEGDAGATIPTDRMEAR